MDEKLVTDEVFKQLRIARTNEKYYRAMAKRHQRRSIGLQVSVAAMTAGSAAAAWVHLASASFPAAAAVVATVAAMVAAVAPLLEWGALARAHSEHAGLWSLMFSDLQALDFDRGAPQPAACRLREVVRQMNMLEVADRTETDLALMERCQDEVNVEYSDQVPLATPPTELILGPAEDETTSEAERAARPAQAVHETAGTGSST